ncbi:hypothetical protein K7432_011891 [Basidiobolus ranarum]|uniref:Uncharacterized protein n=1 Tax=Basidiobolus ranarum TaxID=34480 RepID=A0ABR2VT72_9FUNG
MKRLEEFRVLHYVSTYAISTLSNSSINSTKKRDHVNSATLTLSSPIALTVEKVSVNKYFLSYHWTSNWQIFFQGCLFLLLSSQLLHIFCDAQSATFLLN